MPTERKFKVMFAFFCYGGNGGIASVNPSVLEWWGQLTPKLCADPRIGPNGYGKAIISDTPITMTRNKSVEAAQKWGADILVMIDSDNVPDMYLRDSGVDAKPFFDSSFDFLVKHWDEGPNVVFAPYCGPPMHPIHGGEENVYVFQWTNKSTGDGDDGAFSLAGYHREEAALMQGIHPAGAGPTGVIMYDLRAFGLIDRPYFDYEWNDAHSEKQSTEDVYNTRNISLCGWVKLGRDCLYCNWDAWAGHAKTKIVGAPRIMYNQQVSDTFRKAVKSNIDAGKTIINLDLPPLKKTRKFVGFDVKGKKLDPRTTENGELILGQHLTDEEAAEWVTRPGLGVGMEPEDAEAIVACVTKAAENREFVRVVEVGTWVGNTAKLIHETLKSLGKAHRIDCVDTFQGTPSDHTSDLAKAAGGSTLRAFQENVGELYGGAIFAHVGDSVDIAANWQDKADLIFIDADHSYEGVKNDLIAWRPHLRSGGVFCGHDYQITSLPGVTQAVDEVVGQASDLTELTRVGDSTVWMATFQGKRMPWESSMFDVRTPSESLEEFVPTGV